MRAAMRRLTLIAILFVAVNAASSLAIAQMGEASVDYSLVVYHPAVSIANSRNLNGGGGSIGINFGRFVTIKGELEGYGTTTFTFHPQATPTASTTPGTITTQGNMLTYLFGPQLNFPIHNKMRLFGEALFGGAHSNLYANFFSADQITSLAPSNNGFAMAIGGGLDIKVLPHVLIRPGQFDYFLTRYEWPTLGINNQSNFRYQAGVVFPF
jgi:hypothetical protein